jgi:transporter family-2 protein
MSLQRVGLTFLTALIGASTSVQVAVNGFVGKSVGVNSFAAALNLNLGLVLLSLLHGAEVLLSTTATSPLRFLAWASRPSLLNLCPGLLGLCYVVSSAFLQPVLGSGLFMVSIVAGQLTSAAALDHVTGAARLRLPRAAALAAALGGAVATAWDRLAAANAEAAPVWLLLLGAALTFAAGGLMVVQAHLSHGAAALLPSRLAAAWWSFAVSAGLSWVVFGAQAAGAGADARSRFSAPGTWAALPGWAWTAALCGVAYVCSSIVVPAVIGSGAYFVSLVCGQLLFAAAIDAQGLLGAAVHPLTAARGVGLGVVVIAAAATQVLLIQQQRQEKKALEAVAGGVRTPLVEMGSEESAQISAGSYNRIVNLDS